MSNVPYSALLRYCYSGLESEGKRSFMYRIGVVIASKRVLRILTNVLISFNNLLGNPAMDDINQKNTPGESSDTQQELNACRMQLQMWKEDCLRSRADFENYKKRVERERTEVYRLALTGVFKDLLAIIDDLDRGLSYANTLTSTECKSIIEGLNLTSEQFKKVLAKYGVTAIQESSVFDPALHEAVMEVSSDKPAGSVVQVLQKGYMIQGQVLRPAKVSIAKN